MPVTTITYLDNSGFALEAENRFFVFDYYNDRPVTGRRGLAGGVIDPRCAAGKDVFVFVSHSHFDHYNKIIFQWAKHIENIHYVLSDDVPPHEGALMAQPGNSYKLDGISIDTLRSTDQGSAFLIRACGKTVYHAGDLNWWHWEGEDPKWNAEMAEDYKKEIDKLKGIYI